MLQQYQLPPRPPFQRKATTLSFDEPRSKNPPKGNNKPSGHKKSFSQGTILEDQPAWLDDLLSDDSNSNTKRWFHSRSSSDSMALYEHGSFDQWEDGSGSTNNFNAEQKQEKRHPRQRSRDRKLQYIAELDKTVNDLQLLVSELQHDVSTLLQRQLILSAKNTELKQHVFDLQQHKLFLDNEYQTLRKEAERLKSDLARLSYLNKGQMQAKSGMNHKASNYSSEMLDWRKLNLD